MSEADEQFDAKLQADDAATEVAHSDKKPFSIMKRTFTRRNFVQAGALFAAAYASSNSVPSFARSLPAVGKPIPIRLGLASYSFRHFDRTQLIRFMKQLNVRNLNVKNVKDHLPMDPREEALAVADYAAAGINLHAAGDIDFLIDEDSDVRNKFEYVKRAGIPLLVARDPSAQTLLRIQRFAKEYNIKVAVNNHGPQDKLYPSPVDVWKAVRGLAPSIGCCIDVGHVTAVGENVIQVTREVGKRVMDIHMKDMTSFRRNAKMVAVGEGVMPVRGIFEALMAVKYDGYVDLEYEIHPDDPMPGVIESFAYMRGVLAGMGYRESS